MIEQNRHQDEIRVRGQLEDSLKDEFDESPWSDFLADGYVQDYLDGRMDWKELERFAKTALDKQRRHTRDVLRKYGMLKESEDSDSGGDADTPRRSSFRPSFVIKLPERERKRTDVLLKISMRQAAERPDVKRFRDERLGGERVVYDEAEAFISPGLSEEITDRELADLARRLERDYGWRRNDAAWFVLNGAAPRLRPLTARVSVHQDFVQQDKYGPSYCEITLKVAPWIPSEEVERAFVQARDQVRGGSGPGTVSKKRLEVVRFVEEEYEKRERRPTFEELLQVWNQEYPPHWAYSDYRAFSKAYRQARKEVVHPEYH